MSQLEQLGIVYHDSDWPHGLRCMECDVVFAEGDRYSQRLDSFIDDAAILEIICIRCVL